MVMFAQKTCFWCIYNKLQLDICNLTTYTYLMSLLPDGFTTVVMTTTSTTSIVLTTSSLSLMVTPSSTGKIVPINFGTVLAIMHTKYYESIKADTFHLTVNLIH